MFSQVYDFLVINPNNSFLRAVLLALVTAAISWILTRRGKLRWSSTAQYVYQLPTENGNRLGVWTRQIWITNGGNAPIDQVEIVLASVPQHFELWPPRTFEVKKLETQSREAILLGDLAPKESVTLSILESRPGFVLPEVSTVRSKADVGRFIRMAPQRTYPTWFNLIGAALMLFGIGSAIQFIILAITKVAALFGAAG